MRIAAQPGDVRRLVDHERLNHRSVMAPSASADDAPSSLALRAVSHPASPAVSSETLASYQAIYEQLNPLQLYPDLKARLAELWRLEAVDPASELAVRIRSSREAQGNTLYDAAIPSS
jgi:hypothetical protein